MQKIVWDSRSLPDTLEDRNRFSLWRDVFLSGHAGLDLSPLADQPFQARYEGGQLGAFAIALTFRPFAKIEAQSAPASA